MEVTVITGPAEHCRMGLGSGIDCNVSGLDDTTRLELRIQWVNIAMWGKAGNKQLVLGVFLCDLFLG